MLLVMNVATRKFTLQESYNLKQLFQRSSYLAALDYQPDDLDVPSEIQLSIDKVSFLYDVNNFNKTSIFLFIMCKCIYILGFRCPDANWRDFSVLGIVVGGKKKFLFSIHMYFNVKVVFVLVLSLLRAPCLVS